MTEIDPIPPADDLTEPPPEGPHYSISELLSRNSLLKLGAIGVITGSVLLLFTWSAGWLSPHHLNQVRLIDTFQIVNGTHPGFRRNHAKGVCLAGWFDSNGAAAKLSKATVFKPGRVPVVGRFALAGGMPMMADGPAAVRSMALNFSLPDGEVWRTGMNDIPVFTVRDAQGFEDQLVAGKPDPVTGKPVPAAVKAFLSAHPETVRAMKDIKAHPFASGFANASYNSLDAFRMINTQGRVTAVRWSMVAVDPFAAEPAKAPDDHNYLFDALIARIHKGAAQWHLILTIGRPKDPTNDATIPWPADRQKIDAGTLTVNAIAEEAAGNCRDINFDPLVLPSGIAASDDPLLSARSAAYSVSFTRRARERKDSERRQNQ